MTRDIERDEIYIQTQRTTRKNSTRKTDREPKIDEQKTKKAGGRGAERLTETERGNAAAARPEHEQLPPVALLQPLGPLPEPLHRLLYGSETTRAHAIHVPGKKYSQTFDERVDKESRVDVRSVRIGTFALYLGESFFFSASKECGATLFEMQ